jgi:tRNA(Leu) C34 or U34 (ribose-2'-O)-methylase TrmL
MARNILKGARLILALDQVTDPHNVGAILRSAVALDADAVVTTERHAPEEGPVLAKSASGALDMIKHVRVKNMARFITEMKEQGFGCIALDSDGPASLEDTDFTEKTVLVLGSEGKGVRQGVREACGLLARLDMPGEIRSLNVSNAAVLSLYVARHEDGALGPTYRLKAFKLWGARIKALVAASVFMRIPELFRFGPGEKVLFAVPNRMRRIQNGLTVLGFRAFQQMKALKTIQLMKTGLPAFPYSFKSLLLALFHCKPVHREIHGGLPSLKMFRRKL